MRLTRREFAARMAQGTSLVVLLRERTRAQEGDGGDGGEGGDAGEGGEGDEGGDEGDDGGDEGSPDNGDNGDDSDDGADSGEAGDLIDESTGDRTLASSDLAAATSDPTIDLSDTEWGSLFDTNSDQNS